MKKIKQIALCFFMISATYLVHANDRSIEVKTSIAFIDLTPKSLSWLNQNQQYLIKKQVPVLVLNGNTKTVENLYKKYNKQILIALAPEPGKYTNLLLKQLKIKQLPTLYQP